VKRLMLIVLAAGMLMASKPPHRDAYLLAVEEGITFSGGTSVEEWKAIHQAYPGHLLWVRRNGRDYLIRDEATIRHARALFAGKHVRASEAERALWPLVDGAIRAGLAKPLTR